MDLFGRQSGRITAAPARQSGQISGATEPGRAVGGTDIGAEDTGFSGV